MIGKITGRIDYVAGDHVLIEAGGVGYVVYCAPGTLAALPGPGAMTALYTELLVREDLLQLVGFRTPVEREWHRLLTSVQGVGAKVALGVIDALGPEGVSRALALGDAAAVRAAPGVGPRLASRIVHELADKAAGVIAIGLAASAPVPAPGVAAAAETPAPAQPPAAPVWASDAVSALVNLGFDRVAAARAVAEEGAADAEAGPEALIRGALRRLAPEGG